MSRVWPYLIAVPTFDPATLFPDGWWRPDFSPPWPPTSPSANGGLTAFGTAPDLGSTVNGRIPAHFPNTRRGLRSVAASSNFIGTTNCTIIVFFKTPAAIDRTPDQVAWYSQPPIITTDGGDLGMSLSVSGICGGNGAGGNTSRLTVADSAWMMAALRVSGGRINLRVSQASGTADATDVTATGASIDSFLQLGRSWDDATFWKGEIAEVLTWKATALSSTNLDNMRTYFNGEFAQGLT